MSQDGSSSKSYIKHPTEKARIEGLAFTSFPEDYLPYTSPTYQRKAPYLIWDQQQPYGVFRTSKSEQFRRYFCSTSALVTAVVLLIAAILAIVAVSVYLGVVTNLFRSPIFSISARLRVLEGDEFNDVLLNQTSIDFLTKADYYKALVENLLLSSSLRPAFVAVRVYAFRHGSLMVFFRIHLDRRKLARDDKEAVLITKSLLMEQAISSPSSSFDNLILDLPSIDVREYGEEEWFADDEDELVSWEEADSLTQNQSTHNISSSSPTVPTVLSTSKTIDPKHIYTKTTSPSTPKEFTTMKTVLQTAKKTEAPRVINLKNISAVSQRSTTPASSSSSSGQGAVRYGYAEWRPIDLPQAIQVATLGDFNAPKKEIRMNHGSGFVKPVESDSAKFRTDSVVRPDSSINVAPTIMSSVSLVIRPNSKNRSRDDHENLGTGFVQAVPLERGHDRVLSISELDRKARVDDEEFSFIDGTLAEEQQPQTTSDSSVRVIEVGRVYQLEKQSPNTSEVTTTVSQTIRSEPSSDITEPKFETESFIAIRDTTSVPSMMTSESLLFSEEHTEDIHPEDSEYETSSQTTDTVNIGGESTVLYHSTSDHQVTDSSRDQETTSVVNDLETEESNFTVSDLSSIPPSTNGYDDLKTSEEDLKTPTDHTEEELISTRSVTETDSTETTQVEVGSTQEQKTDRSGKDSKLLGGDPGHSMVPKSSIIPDVTAALQFPVKVREALSENSSLVDSNRPSENPERTNYTFLEDLQRFRKIVQPFSHMNPNDINSGDDFKHPIFTFNSGFPSTLPTIPVTFPDIHDNTPEEDSKAGQNFVSSSQSTQKPENQSSIVGFGKNPIFSSHRCTEDEMFCGSGECVPTNYRCNMRRDCRDNSDERNCTCSDYLTVVGQSQKICDGIIDCWDFSDEENCPWCSPGQFLCPQSKSCVNMSQVCDGSNDCPFGTDERYCVKLAEDESKADGTDYSDEGFLMVRKNGKWGKLCLDPVAEVTQPDSVRLNELGRAVCSSLTYRELKEATRIKDTSKRRDTYYEIASHSLQQHHHRSSTVFKPSTCKSEDAVHVKCQSLECGLRPMAISSSRRRIVGGQTTGSGSWPWQVALYKEGEFQCGAVLVSDSWLLSAGHCFYSTQTAYWSARLGILRRGTELPSPVEKVRHIQKIILHPDYVDKGFINDIALLKLDKPVPFSDYLRPLCLPTPSEDVKHWHGQHCSVVGWGKLFEIGHTFPDSLQEVRLPVISTEECRKRIVFLSMYHITDNMFCAGFERGGRDACLGDSGGPLMCQRQDGRWVLLGITSNGDGCGRPGRPGVYTKVTQYLKWIDQTISSHNLYRNSSATCLGLRCPLGRCVQTYKICDGRFDCADGSDESSCPILPML